MQLYEPLNAFGSRQNTGNRYWRGSYKVIKVGMSPKIRRRNEMEYDEFLAGYKTGAIRFGVDRSRIRLVVGNELYRHLFDTSDYPQMLNRLATVLSLLIIPSLLAALILPFFTLWWVFIPCLALAWFFQRMTYRYQREAVRQLALADPAAYKFLLLEGIIVVDDPSK